jgi:hypothetical protein
MVGTRPPLSTLARTATDSIATGSIVTDSIAISARWTCGGAR